MIAVVTDAHLRSAVAGLRGLGRAGIAAVALSPHRGAAGRWSRFASERALGPDPERDPGGYLRTLGELAERHDGVIVYPAREAGIAPLLGGPLPEGVTPAFGTAEAVAALRDKTALPALAAGAGLATPRELAVGGPAEVRAAAPSWPVVLKPATLPAGIETARVAHSPAELERLLAMLRPEERVVAQAMVEGRPMSLAVVVGRDGELVDSFQEEVMRTWPPEAGSFALTVSVAPDPALFESARALLTGAGYSGLAQLDVILTPDGPVLLDVNTRFYACLPAALRCGVNLPEAWDGVVRGMPHTATSGYPLGVRYRWLEADLTAALRGRPRRLLTGGRGRTAGAMWAADDPLAGVMLAADGVAARLGRRLPRR